MLFLTSIFMKYKDPKTGQTLYGFSQEQLEHTNKQLKKTNQLVQVLVVLVVLFLLITIALVSWVDLNNVITAFVTK